MMAASPPDTPPDYERRIEGGVAQVERAHSPYENVYWFARALIASEYASPGGDTAKMLKLSQSLGALLAVPEPKVAPSKETVWEVLRSFHAPNTQVASKIDKLIVFLDPMITSPQDLTVLKFTIDHLLIPTNELLRRVPSSDREAAEELIRTYLDAEGSEGLKDVILMWDQKGRRWSMEAERVVVVAGFRILRETLDDLLHARRLSRIDADQALTAFVQEFERRLSRGVRPTRAGRSLEDVTGVILDHFDVENYTDAPEHIKAVFEVDKMITLPDGWRIGVSCKRTLRERWKQAASLSPSRMDEYQLRSTWHVLTYTSDLTVPKVEAIGESRGVVYLPDDDHFYQEHRDNARIADYMRPMTAFVSDLREAASQAA